MDCIKLLHVFSAVAVLSGTWYLAFGLRVREGIDPKLRKELGAAMDGKVAPSDVSQRPVLFWVGLTLITLGALLELGAAVFT
jgi:hypothetical protein